MHIPTLLTALTALAHATPLPLSTSPSPNAIEITAASLANKYIITLKPTANVTALTSHIAAAQTIHTRNKLARRSEAVGVENEYAFGEFLGYSGEFDEDTVEELRGMEEVLMVEEDSVMTTLGLVTQSTAPWGLGSISSKSGAASDYIYDSSAGNDTYSYVVDTGIRITHTEFEDRATFGYNAVNDINTDNAGHGTHVAGTIGGKTFGVAKQTNLVAVKIFEGNTGSTSTVIKGFEWAVNDIVANGRQKTAVINMSLGGSGSSTWDAAVTAAWNQGVLAVVAAGNENQLASNRSPARSPEAICVGNVQVNLQRYAGNTGSNYGPAVDIFAPGTAIMSAWPESDTATEILTGTSMASPHVAGLVSYLRGLEGPMEADVVKQRVYELATPGLVQDTKESADLLAYNGNGR